MPNDAKTKLDEATHALQDQPATRGVDQHDAAKAIGSGAAGHKKRTRPSETSKS